MSATARGCDPVVSTGLANAVVTGIVTGSVVALGAIGLALVYSIAEVPNFAHGELLMLGAYMALFVNKPGTVPVFELLTTGTHAATVPGLALVFLVSAAAVLAVVYFLGGREALEGSWWPIDPPPAVGILGHLAIAGAVGVLVVLSTPSIWGGMLMSGVLLAAFAPLQEKVVFRKFRDRGADLATMLIVALGLSFVLRFGTQAFYGGNVRDFQVPDLATVLGARIPLSASQFFDVYLSNAGATVEVINTKVSGAGGDFATVAVVGYGWPMVAVLVALPLVVAVAGYRWRSGGDGGYGAGQTIGPRLTAAIGGVLSVLVLLVVLAGPGTVPGDPLGATRIKLSLMRGLTILIAVAMMALLHVLLKETKLGTAMRASSDNLDLARVTGINTDRVMMATWIIAGAYAAVGGVMLGVLFGQLTPNMGFFLLLPMFAGVILGGVGSVYGAILGSFLVGLSMDVGIFVLNVSGVHRVSIAFVVLLIVLLVKPQGITGGS